MKKNLSFNLDDLRVESFDTLPELTEAQVTDIYGATCGTANETVVCCYPTNGNSTGGGGGGGGNKVY